VLDPHAVWHEPTRTAELILHASPASACDALASAIEFRVAGPDAAWLRSWRDADAVVPPALAAAPDPFEPKVAAALEPALDDGALLWVSSSMPVRDVEAYFPQTSKRIRFLANRGANGIDRRRGLGRGGGAGDGAASLPADRRDRPAARPRGHPRGAAGGRASHGDLPEQRRWRHLRLPAGGRARGRRALRGARGHAERPRPCGSGGPLPGWSTAWHPRPPRCGRRWALPGWSRYAPIARRTCGCTTRWWIGWRRRSDRGEVPASSVGMGHASTTSPSPSAGTACAWSTALSNFLPLATTAWA